MSEMIFNEGPYRLGCHVCEAVTVHFGHHNALMAECAGCENVRDWGGHGIASHVDRGGMYRWEREGLATRDGRLLRVPEPESSRGRVGGPYLSAVQ